MRTLKKRLVPVLAALLLTLALAGCHGSRGMEAFVPPETFDSSRTYNLTFWAKNDTNKTQTAIYEKAIADFKMAYPNISVNLRLYTNYGDIYNDVITNISTGTTPNVCITYPDHIATYLTGSHVVAPLEELCAHPAYGLGGSQVLFDSVRQEEILPAFLAECTFNGHCYALPFMRSTEACYVNKTYVEALGFTLPQVLTWDFIWQVSESAMQTDSQGRYTVNGQNVLIPFIYKSTDNMMIQYLRQSGAGYSTAGGEIQLFNDVTRDFLYTVGEYGRNKAFSTFKISSYPANFLNAGQCIFAVDSTAGATWMGSDAPLVDISEDALVDFETAVLPVPQTDPEHPQMISQGPSVCVFNKADPQEVVASWLFAQYLLTNDVQTAYAQTEGYIPVTSKALDSPAYQDYLSRSGEDDQLHYSVKIQASQLLLDNTENTFVTPVFNGSASLRDAAGQLIENTVKSGRRGETIDDAYLDQLFEDVAVLYRLNQTGTAAAGKADLGPLPAGSIALLASLAGLWVLLILYVILQRKRQKACKKDNSAKSR